MIVIDVAFALLLTDDFTGKKIENEQFAFQIHGKTYKPVHNEPGIYVFLEPMEEEELVEIYSSSYHATSVVIRKRELNAKEPVRDIRMYVRPGKKTGFPYEYLTGRLEENGVTFPAEIGVKSQKETGLSIKEIVRKENSTFISVNGFTRDPLIGKTFAVSSPKGTEVFVMIDKVSMNEFRISENLREAYKTATPIERIYRSVTDKEGNYAIPVDAGENGSTREVFVLQDKISRTGKEV